MGMNLSEMQKKVLMSAPSNRIGAKCVIVKNSPIHRLMMDLGYLGKDGGLTRQGSIAREKLVSAALEAAFG